MTSDDELTDELADTVNDHDVGNRERLLRRIKTAQAYLTNATRGQTVPQEVLDDCTVSVAADLWQAKDARNGIMGLDSDGIEPFRISSDPLRTARPKLRAAGIRTGMGIA